MTDKINAKLSSTYIKKVLSDDLKDGVISEEPVVKSTKKGYYWLLTVYRENVSGEFSLEKIINKIRENVKHVRSVVGQEEIGEVSKEKHFHISVTLSISSSTPVTSFNKILPGVYISNTSIKGRYDSYCSKSYTKSKDSKSIVWSEKDLEIDKYHRLEIEDENKGVPNPIDAIKKDLDKEIAKIKADNKKFEERVTESVDSIADQVESNTKAINRLENKVNLLIKHLRLKIKEEESDSD